RPCCPPVREQTVRGRTAPTRLARRGLRRYRWRSDLIVLGSVRTAGTERLGVALLASAFVVALHRQRVLPPPELLDVLSQSLRHGVLVGLSGVGRADVHPPVGLSCVGVLIAEIPALCIGGHHRFLLCSPGVLTGSTCAGRPALVPLSACRCPDAPPYSGLAVSTPAATASGRSRRGPSDDR